MEFEGSWRLKGLGAVAPNPELEEKMMLFGQFIGDWEIEERWLAPDETWKEGTGAVHFAWILEGRAVQDVWSDYDGNPLRWIFSEITPNGFRWRAEESRDNQKTWQLTEDMSIRRSNV